MPLPAPANPSSTNNVRAQRSADSSAGLETRHLLPRCRSARGRLAGRLPALRLQTSADKAVRKRADGTGPAGSRVQLTQPGTLFQVHGAVGRARCWGADAFPWWSRESGPRRPEAPAPLNETRPPRVSSRVNAALATKAEMGEACLVHTLPFTPFKLRVRLCRRAQHLARNKHSASLLRKRVRVPGCLLRSVCRYVTSMLAALPTPPQGKASEGFKPRTEGPQRRPLVATRGQHPLLQQRLIKPFRAAAVASTRP